MKHSWLGDICKVCGIQRKQVKVENNLGKFYTTNYFDKQWQQLPGRPLCKIK